MRLGGETPAPVSLASEARAGNPGTSDADALALRDRRVAPLETCVGATRGDGLGPLGGWPDVLFAALAQAAAMSGFGVVVAALAIAAERVTGSGALGTFALALEFFARACAAVPAARAAARRGRRAVLLLGAACGVVGSLLVALDMFIKSYVVGVVGVFGVGVANGVAQQARFVAADAVADADRRRALSVCVAGGAVAAFVGPELAKASRTWLPELEYGGCFLAMALCYASFFVCAAATRSAGRADSDFYSSRRVADSLEEDSLEENISLFETFKSASANARKGTACVAIAWPLMFLVMSAAPLAMMGAKEGGHGFDETADAIRAHLLAMFAPGALGTGDLVRRAGPDVVAHVGCGLFVACAVFSNAFVPVTAADDVGGGGRVPYWAYRDGLVVLGLAWHLVFVAGSAALSDESAKTQGACESLAFALVAVCASTSGAILQRMGWRALNAFAAASAALSLYLLRERFLSASEKKKTRKDADAADPGAPASAA